MSSAPPASSGKKPTEKDLSRACHVLRRPTNQDAAVKFHLSTCPDNRDSPGSDGRSPAQLPGPGVDPRRVSPYDAVLALAVGLRRERRLGAGLDPSLAIALSRRWQPPHLTGPPASQSEDHTQQGLRFQQDAGMRNGSAPILTCRSQPARDNAAHIDAGDARVRVASSVTALVEDLTKGAVRDRCQVFWRDTRCERAHQSLHSFYS